MFLKIKDKDAQIVSFVLNRPQKKIFQIYEKAKARGGLLRFIIVKARQEGVSTLFEGIIFHRTITEFNRKAVIVGHEKDSANNLFEMTKRFYDYLPEPMKPALEFSNEKKLGFGNLQSEVKIASADAGITLKRSDTIQDLHCTEVAFWRDQKGGLLALLQTVPDLPGTLIVLESTANGIGGEFYDRYQAAKEGKSDYIPIFLAWFEMPDYQKEFYDKQECEWFEGSLNEAEVRLREAYGLSLEQLNWRRWAIENKCGGDEKMFQQEYPSNDVEAFLASGRQVFDTDICVANFQNSKKPLQRGDLLYTHDKNGKISGVEFVENRNGFISLYESIEQLQNQREEFRFVAGSDVAEGLEQGDYNTIRVLDRKTLRVCLTWHGHIHPDLFAEEQHKIHLFLNKDIFFCTERNNHGLTTIVTAQRLGIYQFYETDYKKGYAVTTDKLGFKTTSGTKPQLISALIPAIRDADFEDNEKEFWSEALTFVRNSKGQMQAQNKDRDPATKCFDDRVIAQALMWRCHQWLPPVKALKRPREKQWFELIAEANVPKTRTKSWRDPFSV